MSQDSVALAARRTGVAFWLVVVCVVGFLDLGLGYLLALFSAGFLFLCHWNVPRGLWGYLAAVAVSLSLFLALSFFWLVYLFGATIGGECSFEEVRCTRKGELLAHYGGLGLLPLLAVAVGAGFLVLRRR
jgi:hypothetical protein